MQLIGGSVDQVTAVSEALKMLERSSNSSTKKTLILVGDVGPYENYKGKVMMDYSQLPVQVNKEYEEDVYQMIAQFGSKSNTSFISIYTGYRLMNESPVVEATATESINFFETSSSRFNEASGNQNRSAYYSDPEAMLLHILIGLLAA